MSPQTPPYPGQTCLVHETTRLKQGGCSGRGRRGPSEHGKRPRAPGLGGGSSGERCERAGGPGARAGRGARRCQSHQVERQKLLELCQPLWLIRNNRTVAKAVTAKSSTAAVLFTAMCNELPNSKGSELRQKHRLGSNEK